MSDLKSTRLIWLKGWLFLGIGVIAATLLLLESPQPKTAALLALAIWAFCRFYYFAFYVIEHYVDGEHRFAGLFDFAKYAVAKRFGWRTDVEGPPPRPPRPPR